MDDRLAEALGAIRSAGVEELEVIERALEERRRELGLHKMGEGASPPQVFEGRPYGDGWLQLESRIYHRKDGGLSVRAPYWYFRGTTRRAGRGSSTWARPRTQRPSLSRSGGVVVGREGAEVISSLYPAPMRALRIAKEAKLRAPTTTMCPPCVWPPQPLHVARRRSRRPSRRRAGRRGV
jgi:hypothetical protein